MNLLKSSKSAARCVAVLALVVHLPACVAPADLAEDASDVVASAGLTADQKRRAEQITSVFENDTLELQYAYIENLGDGRGFTAGRAGFTTATGDLVLVAERYAMDAPTALLAGLLPRLRELAASGSDSVTGLEDLPAAWSQAASDARFHAAQDHVSDQLYYQPAVTNWRREGLVSALSLAAIYDAIIQHGEGDDPDGLPAMIQRAGRRAGGNPASGVGEAAWLQAFLEVRLATLGNAVNPATRAQWRESTDRVQPFQALLAAQNWKLDGPIHIQTANHQAIVP